MRERRKRHTHSKIEQHRMNEYEHGINLFKFSSRRFSRMAAVVGVIIKKRGYANSFSRIVLSFCTFAPAVLHTTMATTLLHIICVSSHGTGVVFIAAIRAPRNEVF